MYRYNILEMHNHKHQFIHVHNSGHKKHIHVEGSGMKRHISVGKHQAHGGGLYHQYKEHVEHSYHPHTQEREVHEPSKHMQDKLNKLKFGSNKKNIKLSY